MTKNMFEANSRLKVEKVPNAQVFSILHKLCNLRLHRSLASKIGVVLNCAKVRCICVQVCNPLIGGVAQHTRTLGGEFPYKKKEVIS